MAVVDPLTIPTDIPLDGLKEALRSFTDRGQLLTDKLVSPIAIVQPRPTIDLPRFAPAGTFIAAQFETLACGLRKLRRANR